MKWFDSKPRKSGIADKVIAHEEENPQRNKRQSDRVKQDVDPDFFIFQSLNFFEKD
jgi:hypothetical protein